MTIWHKLLCKRSEMQLLGTLNGGQSFRWKKQIVDDKEQWIGVFANRVWLLEQMDEWISYQVFSNDDCANTNVTDEEIKDNERLLANYFHLNVNIEEYYKLWSSVDPYFQEASKQFYGIRILRQELTENIFSFICSSNNNIARISSMVEKLAKLFGKKINVVNGTTYYAFPELISLYVPNLEQILKENGFGYRAKYISKSVSYIKDEGGGMWLENLKQMDYSSAKENLMKLTGVGAKVADCVCLMSLGHLQAIPVDTHIYQVAVNFYMPNLRKQKSLTAKVYDEIGDHYRNLYGPLAGWAHTILFCADLKKFQANTFTNKVKNKKKRKHE